MNYLKKKTVELVQNKLETKQFASAKTSLYVVKTRLEQKKICHFYNKQKVSFTALCWPQI
jgi:hypothetical protein